MNHADKLFVNLITPSPPKA